MAHAQSQGETTTTTSTTLEKPATGHRGIKSYGNSKYAQYPNFQNQFVTNKEISASEYFTGGEEFPSDENVETTEKEALVEGRLLLILSDPYTEGSAMHSLYFQKDEEGEGGKVITKAHKAIRHNSSSGLISPVVPSFGWDKDGKALDITTVAGTFTDGDEGVFNSIIKLESAGTDEYETPIWYLRFYDSGLYLPPPWS